MKLENPWVQVECRQHDVAANGLPTFLQEQYGQLGEDLILDGLLKAYFARKGLPAAAIRYMEVGANHPIQTSNTYLFRHKWQGKGVLVEANPALVTALRKVRGDDVVLNLAVVPPGSPAKVRINIATHSELSSVDAGHIRSFGNIGTVDHAVEVESVTLDELLESCFPQGLHLLSIDIEGLDLEVIEKSRFARRPVFVITEPSRHYHADAEAGFARAMAAKGYAEVARTDYNLIYGDRDALGLAPLDLSTSPATPAGASAAPAGIAPRRSIRTFDVFDTLIARRCIRAEQVFLQIEQQIGVPGFAAQRVQAERDVEAGEYTLADIYGRLAGMMDWTEERAREVAGLELQAELDNVLPIADNLARLDSESVLLTDMYLPDGAIRLLLERAGLVLDLPIVRSSHGKRSGVLWRDCAQQQIQCVHLGDNTQADVAMATQAGMRARHTRLAEPTPVEKHLYVNGFPRLVEALRAARLMSRKPGMPDWLYRLQTELNVPVLVTCAAMLLGHAAGTGCDKVLFASRDGRYLKRAYDAVAAALGVAGPASEYWYTSRAARSSGDAAYLDYCRQAFTAQSLLVDLCGTGTSIAKLLALLGLPSEAAPKAFLCQLVDDPEQSRRLSRRYGLAEDQPLEVVSLLSTRSFLGNEALELLNYVPEGMVRGVARVAGGWMPLRDPIEFDDDVRPLVDGQHTFLLEMFGHLRTTLTADAFAEIDAQGPQLLAALHEAAALMDEPLASMSAAWLPAHRLAEVALMGTNA